MAGADNGGGDDHGDHDDHDDQDALWLVLSLFPNLFKEKIKSWTQCRCPLLCTNENEKEYTSVHMRIGHRPHPHHHIIIPQNINAHDFSCR